jgi:diacylglycerol kinase family enzyme
MSISPSAVVAAAVPGAPSITHCARRKLRAVKRAVLIVNPFATRVTEERIARVEAAFGRVAAVATELTTHPRHATELVEQAGADVDAIFVFSGDGGFNEAVNGAGGTVPLGFIPGGGTSVLPRALGLPVDPVAAAERLAGALAAGRVRRISVGRVNGRRFAFSAGVGFDAEAVRRMDAHGRAADGRRPGDVRFAVTIARMLIERRGRYEPALEVEGLGRAAFALVANASPYTYVKGIPLTVAPDAEFELGLDVVAPVRVRPAFVPRFLRYALRGRGQERDPAILLAHDLDRISVRCDAPMPLQADGEDLGDVEHAVFEAERDAVAVLV